MLYTSNFEHLHQYSRKAGVKFLQTALSELAKGFDAPAEKAVLLFLTEEFLTPELDAVVQEIWKLERLSVLDRETEPTTVQLDHEVAWNAAVEKADEMDRARREPAAAAVAESIPF